MVYCCFLLSFFVSSLRMSATTCWYFWLHWKYFAERLYYCYILLFCTWPLSDWLCDVTFSRNFIPAQWRHIIVTMVFCPISLFPPHVWVLPIFVITDYIVSNLMGDYIISVYHYFVRDSYWINCDVSYSLDISFQHNGAMSSLSWFIVVVVLYLFVSSSRMSAITCYGFWLLQKYFVERSYYHYTSLFFTRPLSSWLRSVTSSWDFIPYQWRCITVAVCFCYLQWHYSELFS